jgi:IclR family pca regulon transcriptional regulator
VVTPGVVMLATRSDEEIGAWIKAHDFVGFTSHTVTDKARFRAEVREAREQDYWTTGQQLDPGLRGIAVALQDRKGACKGAMSVTVPSASYTEAQVVDKLLPLLREATQALQPLL